MIIFEWLAVALFMFCVYLVAAFYLVKLLFSGSQFDDPEEDEESD